MLNRREWLAGAGAATLSGAARPAPRIAAIVTEYRLDSHADVIVGPMLEGYQYGGRMQAPRVHVVSMYTDQVPANDMSRALAAKHGFRIFPTVREALTLGGPTLGVDGVVLIGEHGRYPVNQWGQRLYPRYRLYKQIMEVFGASSRTVPVYCDKHLSTDWDEAKWMYDESRERGFPLMAGSSLPLAPRKPPLELPLGAPVEHAVATWYGDKEAYGFHTLETLQCMVERRAGGETGIAAVECLEGPAVWEWTGAHPWAARLLDQALQRSERRKPGAPRQNVAHPILFLLTYRSTLPAAVYLLNGHTDDATFAADLRDRVEPVSTEIVMGRTRPYTLFYPLVHSIEELMITRQEPYPVERTLLTTGALAALMRSQGKRVETPWLNVRYRAGKGGPMPQPGARSHPGSGRSN